MEDEEEAGDEQLEPEETANIKKMFNKADKNGNGKIELEEIPLLQKEFEHGGDEL